MKPIVIKLSSELDEVHLHCLSDLHIGDRLCDYKAITEKIQEIADDPKAYAILGGDLINNSTTQSIGDTYSESIPPMEQLQKAVDTLEPIKGKILGAVSGNHELRTYRQDGIDLTRLICRQLEIEDYYRPEAALIFLSFGTNIRRKSENRNIRYLIFCQHGSRGGRKIGGKANALADEALIVDADCYFIGHTHSSLVFKDRFIRTERASAGIQYVERVFVNTSAQLDYGGYASREGYQPASKSNPVVYLSGDRRKIEVKL